MLIDYGYAETAFGAPPDGRVQSLDEAVAWILNRIQREEASDAAAR